LIAIAIAIASLDFCYPSVVKETIYADVSFYQGI
jgi:hypothetical protein